MSLFREAWEGCGDDAQRRDRTALAARYAAWAGCTFLWGGASVAFATSLGPAFVFLALGVVLLVVAAVFRARLVRPSDNLLFEVPCSGLLAITFVLPLWVGLAIATGVTLTFAPKLADWAYDLSQHFLFVHPALAILCGSYLVVLGVVLVARLRSGQRRLSERADSPDAHHP
jgi:hypothetical protein